MQRILALGLFVAAMAQLGLAQWTGGLSSYPGGYLLMVYKITVPEAHYTYTLELIPKEGGSTRCAPRFHRIRLWRRSPIPGSSSSGNPPHGYRRPGGSPITSRSLG